jgi:hypothetical protein
MVLQRLVDIRRILTHFLVNVLLSIGFPEIDVMLRTSSKLVSLAAAALVALPAAAGDFGGRPFQRHHRFYGNGSPVFGHDIGHNRGLGIRPQRFAGRDIAGGYDGVGRRHERSRLLKRFYSPSSNYARSNVLVVFQPWQDEGSAGTYSGSSYAFETGGGTYVGGSGYGFYTTQQAPKLAPMAKVIDVASGANSCSYEASVCVIRP